MSIKSRPTYTGLRPIVAARRHVVAAQPQAVAAVCNMLDEAEAQGLECVTQNTEVVLAAPESSPAFEALRQRGITVFAANSAQLDPQAVAFDKLDSLLTDATMSTRLYVAGTEGFIGRVGQVAASHGIDYRSIRSEHVGSLARRVQCVHCKTTLEAVTTSHVKCDGCGLNLLVRDHYSQRLAAFQGVCANAEDRSEHVQPVEVFR